MSPHHTTATDTKEKSERKYIEIKIHLHLFFFLRLLFNVRNNTAQPTLQQKKKTVGF